MTDEDRAALIEAQRAINSMKNEAETAGAGGDEQMLQEACEEISRQGLEAASAIDAALAAQPAPQAYELDDPDLALLEKCRKAIEYDNNGDPMKDVMDTDDFHDAVRLLVTIVDANAKEIQPEKQEVQAAVPWDVRIADEYKPRRLRLTIGVQSFDLDVQDDADEPGRMEWFRDQLTKAMRLVAPVPAPQEVDALMKLISELSAYNYRRGINYTTPGDYSVGKRLEQEILNAITAMAQERDNHRRAAKWETDLCEQALTDLKSAQARIAGFELLSETAYHALKSYEHGNAATELAAVVARRLEAALSKGKPQATPDNPFGLVRGVEVPIYRNEGTPQDLQQVMDFLCGSAPLDGVWFGEAHPTERGQFWWRRYLLRAAIAGQAAPSAKEKP